jgi:hypothetical protein
MQRMFRAACLPLFRSASFKARYCGSFVFHPSLCLVADLPFRVGSQGSKLDGETDSPFSVLKPEDISCVIQRPFVTAFPSAVATPNYLVIRWWENILTSRFRGRCSVRTAGTLLRVSGWGIFQTWFIRPCITCQPPPPSQIFFPSTNHVPPYRVAKSFKRCPAWAGVYPDTFTLR